MKIYKAIKKLPINIETPWHKSIDGAFEDLPDCHIGGNAIVLKPEKVKDYFPEIAEKYKNLSITIKINHRFQNEGFNPDNYIIKNIAWMEGFGVRVYEIMEVEDTDTTVFKAQVMKYIEGDFPSINEARKLWSKYEKKLKRYHIKRIDIDNWQANFKGNKLLDFDEFMFEDKEAYRKDLYDRYNKTAYWGSTSAPYQHIPRIGINGCRSEERFFKLGMMNLDLTGKTVLDIGCSGGQTLYWALERNAKRVVGIDTLEIARVTFEMANYHKKFNIETVGCDLTEHNVAEIIRKQTGIDSFDYVIMFSVNHHIGFHQYMKDLCKGTLFLECNAAKMPEIEVEEYPRDLALLGYTEFEYRGQVNESGGRSLFICH